MLIYAITIRVSLEIYQIDFEIFEGDLKLLLAFKKGC